MNKTQKKAKSLTKKITSKFVKGKKGKTLGSILAVIVVAIIGILNMNGINFINTSSVDKIVFANCVDGDTAKFTIEGEKETVRFLAIDMPETVKSGAPVEEYGKQASEFTCNALSSAKSIRLEFEEGNDRDKYGRLLAWVFVDDSLLQEDLVENGLAEVAYIYDDYKYTYKLDSAQRSAKNNKINLWNN